MYGDGRRHRVRRRHSARLRRDADLPDLLAPSVGDAHSHSSHPVLRTSSCLCLCIREVKLFFRGEGGPDRSLARSLPSGAASHLCSDCAMRRGEEGKRERTLYVLRRYTRGRTDGRTEGEDRQALGRLKSRSVHVGTTYGTTAPSAEASASVPSAMLDAEKKRKRRGRKREKST